MMAVELGSERLCCNHTKQFLCLHRYTNSDKCDERHCAEPTSNSLATQTIALVAKRSSEQETEMTDATVEQHGESKRRREHPELPQAVDSSSSSSSSSEGSTDTVMGSVEMCTIPPPKRNRGHERDEHQLASNGSIPTKLAHEAAC